MEYGLKNVCKSDIIQANKFLEVVHTGFESECGCLPMPKFFLNQWLQVGKFQDGLRSLTEQGSEISPETVLPIMVSIVEGASGEDDIDGVAINTLAKGVRLMKHELGAADMDDQWFIKKFGQIYERVMALRSNDDYVVNPVQMDKFLDLVSFFMRKANEYKEDFVEIERTEQKQEFGGVTATFVVFDLHGENNVAAFCKVLRCCSAVCVEATEDGAVCISCTVPRVFVRDHE